MRDSSIICRAAVEAKGIFVMHDSFPPERRHGFCLAMATRVYHYQHKQPEFTDGAFSRCSMKLPMR